MQKIGHENFDKSKCNKDIISNNNINQIIEDLNIRLRFNYFKIKVLILL